ncbi:MULTISPECIES: flagellar brake protein [Gammaproteobacteria]|jgi:c-di-GMP-binding flagellar brake protein YcgR|uniref:Flagellar brake protein YcgR n=1 Tax=Xanthomonas boreopolis TaxID=86183 RepID=A0A919F4Q6_9XANT|nr:flagellar brake protein [Pseudomonas sp. Hp2]GHH46189.1 flagellar brake protein YcgR [[Pseudomonas] boreopolis]
MAEGNASEAPGDAPGEGAEGDEKYLVRNPRQIRGLLQSLVQQRSLITAHVGGRDLFFPTAVLDVEDAGDQAWLILDGSPQEASNRAAAEAGYLLCFAQLERVRVRFRVAGHRRIERDAHVAFRAPLPDAFYYLQRREHYRLETPVTESPSCLLRFEHESGRRIELDLRVIDISGGGLAVALAPGMPLPELHRTCRDCVLKLPDQDPIALPLTACNQFRQTLPNGQESIRMGLQFTDLPRGAGEAIQRYIFRVDRQRNARKSGVF